MIRRFANLHRTLVCISLILHAQLHVVGPACLVLDHYSIAYVNSIRFEMRISGNIGESPVHIIPFSSFVLSSKGLNDTHFGVFTNRFGRDVAAGLQSCYTCFNLGVLSCCCTAVVQNSARRPGRSDFRRVLSTHRLAAIETCNLIKGH